MNELITRIKRRFEMDQAEARKAVAPGEIPISYESITPQWLTSVVCRDTPGAKVVGSSLGEVDNGSSNRRRIFLAYNEQGRAAGLPRSVFCKASFDLLNRIMLGVSNCAHTEVTFYNKIRPLLDIEAPVSLFAGYDPESFASIVVLKDIAEEVTFCNQNTLMTWERAVSQMRLLSALHSRFYESDLIKDNRLGLSTWPAMWKNQVDNELEKYSNKGFRESQDLMPPRLYRRYEEIWPATARCVELHKSRPQTLTHCDVHLKNWFVRGEQQMGLNDWQTISSGHWSRDLAYAISAALTIEQRRAWEKDLIRAYLEGLGAGGAEVPRFERAWDYYRQQLFSALAFWTVTLTPAPTQPEMQPRETTVEFIKRIAHAIDDLDALDSMPA